MSLTEFEKTILLTFFVLAKGSTNRAVPLESLLAKFPIRNRRMIRNYIKRFTKEDLLVKQGKEESYKVGKKTLKIISAFLVSGARVRV